MTLPFYDVNVVIFDCDSTLSAVEGIDELAHRKGVSEQLVPLTTAAMEGRMKLEEIYGRRLDLICPDQEDINWLAQRYIENVVSDAGEVIRALQDAGKQVHIVSGGILQAVSSFAGHIGIGDNHIHAVELYLADDGSYLGYDEKSPLAHSGGKKSICRQIRQAEGKAIMVGDGITDLEASQEGIDFIGFGGVISRKQVRTKAPDFIPGPGLWALLQRVLR